MISKRFLALLAAIVVALPTTQAVEVPQPPTLSTLVPAKDLIDQVDYYIEELEECVEDLEEYQDSVEKIKRYSNSLAVIALTIGLHDQKSEMQRAAPGLLKASQTLAKAKDFSAAKTAVAQIKAALSTSADPSGLKWTKVADLHALMDQVPLINTRIKRYLRRFEKGAPYVAGNSAALVAISQGSMANADETEAPDKVAEWFQYCIQMRDAAGALNKAVNAKDEGAAKAAMEALQQSCDDCHSVFHTDDH